MMCKIRKRLISLRNFLQCLQSLNDKCSSNYVCRSYEFKSGIRLISELPQHAKATPLQANVTPLHAKVAQRHAKFTR